LLILAIRRAPVVSLLTASDIEAPLPGLSEPAERMARHERALVVSRKAFPTQSCRVSRSQQGIKRADWSGLRCEDGHYCAISPAGEDSGDLDRGHVLHPGRGG
jgi:hypothetical protein